MKKYNDFALESASEDSDVLNYKDLRFSGNAVVYGSEGQAALEARPLETPQTEETVSREAEIEYRPMPSAILFEDAGRVSRRRKAPRALSAVLSLAVTLIAAAALFGLVRMSGEINALTVTANDLTREINSLRKEETRLSYIINSEMTELEMLDYAESTLRMEPATSSNTVNMNFGGGDRFELGDTSDGSDTIFGHLSGLVRTFANYIG
ncbi:MAG: hypothetical protein IKM29_01395 [Clostridia bacterium]|nr:hypothetical protein [Clostridia bacterium]